MADPEDRKDEELEVDEQSVSDMEVPEGESEEAKGGMDANVLFGSGGKTKIGTGCRDGVTIRKTC